MVGGARSSTGISLVLAAFCPHCNLKLLYMTRTAAVLCSLLLPLVAVHALICGSDVVILVSSLHITYSLSAFCLVCFHAPDEFT